MTLATSPSRTGAPLLVGDDLTAECRRVVELAARMNHLGVVDAVERAGGLVDVDGIESRLASLSMPMPRAASAAGSA